MLKNAVILCAPLVCVMPLAHAELVVIVSSKSPVLELSLNQVANIYTLRGHNLSL